MRASEIRELLKLLDRPGMVSFAGGIPDPSLFEVDAFRNVYGDVLTRSESALQYSTTEGFPPLRRWIAQYMSDRGVPCGEENVLVTHGSQQALDLIGKLFVDPGSSVIMTAPTYLGALQSFTAFEPEFDSVRFSDGLALTNATNARLLYLVPDFANPTGQTLSKQDRVAALELARRAGAILVEDAAYTDLRYEGDAEPRIAALDVAQSGSIEASRTLYCGTFSKTLSPGLRVGWVCGPASLIRRLTLIKQASDLHTSTINQQVIFRIASGYFDQAVARARDTYVQRRDVMLSTLAKYAPQGVRWTTPSGGLFVWLTLPQQLESGALLEKAVARNLAFVPGNAFFADGSGSDHLRLSFSLLDEKTIASGVADLCGLLDDELRRAA
jgi:DNA-binding transcriptional MocR family regulator